MVRSLLDVFLPLGNRGPRIQLGVRTSLNLSKLLNFVGLNISAELIFVLQNMFVLISVYRNRCVSEGSNHLPFWFRLFHYYGVGDRQECS